MPDETIYALPRASSVSDSPFSEWRCCLLTQFLSLAKVKSSPVHEELSGSYGEISNRADMRFDLRPDLATIGWQVNIKRELQHICLPIFTEWRSSV